MKTTSKKKIIVSALALAMGAALAGSISGSVAWYQYSTRAAAQIAGTAAGTVGSLQVKGGKVGGSMSTYGNKVSFSAEQFKPMSIYKDGSDVHYVNAPVYQTELLPEFGSGDTPYYIDYEFYFKFEENNVQKAKNVYLSYFEIEDQGSHDVTPAVRVQILGSHEFLLGANTAAETTTTHGNLDLNGNGVLDTDEWDCMDAGTTKLEYKNAASGGESYTSNAHDDALIDKAAADLDPYHIDSLTGNSDKILTATKTSGDSEKVTVRIWLEGWALLDSTASWSRDYLNQDFNVNMQFICEATVL